MSEIIEKQADTGPKRDERGRLLPGQCANKNGRPRKEKCFSDIARSLLGAKKIDIEYTFPSGGTMKTAKVHIESDKTIYHGLVCALVKEGMDGNVQAIKELIDRTEGRAKENMDLTTKGDKIASNVYNIINAEQKEVIEKLHEKADDL